MVPLHNCIMLLPLIITGAQHAQCFGSMVRMAHGCYLHGWPASSNMVECMSQNYLLFIYLFRIFFFLLQLCILFFCALITDKVVDYVIIGQIKRGSVEVMLDLNHLFLF